MDRLHALLSRVLGLLPQAAPHSHAAAWLLYALLRLLALADAVGCEAARAAAQRVLGLVRERGRLGRDAKLGKPLARLQVRLRRGGRSLLAPACLLDCFLHGGFRSSSC